jgi:SMODS-associated and fused to various effectors sensor domain
MTQTTSRNYSDRTLKILWGRAAGRCAVPSCRIDLITDATDHDPMVLIGEIAHIEAASNRGPRANKARPKKARDGYDNLILLCKNCHSRFDGQQNSNTVDFITQLKEDHESWVRNSLPERGRSTTGWAVILLQGAYPFDLEPTIAALVPDFPAGSPIVFKADPQLESWQSICQRLAMEIARILETGDPFDFRLAVFPLAPVSACLGMGYYLTNRPRVRLFQYHRDDHSWAWLAAIEAADHIDVVGAPDSRSSDAGDIAICFHLSAHIHPEQLVELNLNCARIINLTVPSPNTGWLRSESQLKGLAKTARKVFESCLAFHPNASRWHVLYAGPAPGAVAVGQQLNPTMCPMVQFYEFRRDTSPAYSASFSVGG